MLAIARTIVTVTFKYVHVHIYVCVCLCSQDCIASAEGLLRYTT